ncbi:MAG: ferredoxin [Kiritimatiellae bacterium]|nr:ferredoxin [Kiritimatiellia bacterium]
MTFRVDQDACIGCGACEGTCPAVFELVDFKSTVKVDPVPDDLRRSALEAEEGCPVGAISHS